MNPNMTIDPTEAFCAAVQAPAVACMGLILVALCVAKLLTGRPEMPTKSR